MKCNQWTLWRRFCLVMLTLFFLPGLLHAAELKIEGYTNALSFAPGDKVSFHVSTNAPSYSVRIVRGGVTNDIVWEKSGIKGKQYPTPDKAWATGPGWPESFSLEIPKNWRSGYYIITFMTEGVPGRRDQSEHFFVLRAAHPGKDSKIALMIPTATLNAYNTWGGNNLYESAVKVSLQRPIAPGFISKPQPMERIADIDGPNENYEADFFRWLEEHNLPQWVGAAGWVTYEQPFVRWAEGEGYRFDYITSEDLVLRPELLDNYKLLLSVGHDEYWSWEMRDAVESRIEKGLNLAWFSGNSVYWQVRYEDDYNTMVCYKTPYHEDPILNDPTKKHLLTTIWSAPNLGRPENTMIGLSFNHGGYARIGGATPYSAGGYQIYRPDHWVFENTGLRWGDQFGNEDFIVGYEVDGLLYTIDDEGYPVPTGKDGTPEDAVILGMAPASLWSREYSPQYILGAIPDSELAAIVITGDKKNWRQFIHGNAAMVIFNNGKGTVFNAGSTDWVYGLKGGDQRVEQVTRNVLNRLSR